MQIQEVIIKKGVSQSKKDLCYTIAVEFCTIDLIHREKYKISFPIVMMAISTLLLTKF